MAFKHQISPITDRIVPRNTSQVLHYQTEASLEEFDKECTTMRMARHPNVVRMLGMCAEDDDGDMSLLMEYCLLGDLRHYLMDRTKVLSTSPCLPCWAVAHCLLACAGSNAKHLFHPAQHNITNMERLWFAQQTACGFAYLASLNIVHRDIAARNILLDSPNMASYGFALPKVQDGPRASFCLAPSLTFVSFRRYTATSHVP